MNLIADTVIAMYAADGEQNEYLVFDDKVDLLGDSDQLGSVLEIDNGKDAESDDDMDDLLEDDSDYGESDSDASNNQSDFDEDKDY